MLKALLWFWQLPQNLIGFIMSRGSKDIRVYDLEKCRVKIYFTSNVFDCGVSMGEYIMLDYKNYFNWLKSFPKDSIPYVIKHEHGHRICSRILGPFYLITVGLRSALGNIWDRLFHKNWTNKQRQKWYYNQWVEKLADKLGGVNRQWED